MIVLSLIVPVRMIYDDTTCLRCNSEIKVYKKDISLRCGKCGAHYEVVSENMEDDIPNVSYDFKGHKCIHQEIGINLTAEEKWCQEDCPSPGMYCKVHCSDEKITSAKQSITYAKNRVERAEDHLKDLEESTKIWLVKELSGLNEEQDDSISEDENG